MVKTHEKCATSGSVGTLKRPRLEPPRFLINPIYTDSTFAQEFRADLTEKHPFPHWQLRDFLHVDPSVLERIEAELISYPSWNRKENDLYSLFQTPDLHAIEKAEHPAIANFRDFLCDEIRTWLENVSGVELLSQVDATGSCYASTDCLLPHSDEVDNRRFAFVYYFTQEPWEESFGGQTNIYNSNEDCEPTTIFTSLLPYRNSLLLFEVSDRSWHSVAEVLGEDNDPRLSINGWFHSSRYIKPRVRSALSLPRISPKDEADISFIFNPRIVGEKSKTDMGKVFEAEKELLVKCAFKEEFNAQMIEQLDSADWVEKGPVNKRWIAELEFEDFTTGGCVAKFMEALRSRTMMSFLKELTRLQHKDPITTVQIFRLIPGCYTILGDEDAEQFLKSGDSCDFWFYFGKSQWTEDAGGQIVYIRKDAEEPVLRCPPTINAMAIVYREKDVFPFLKYVNHLARPEPLYIVAFSIYDRVE
ncbi:hypothetical protein Angca_003224, partial [Angiostrongylus cantonensis]